MITLFNRIGPFAVFMILIAGVAVWFPSFRELHTEWFHYDTHPMPFYQLLKELLPRDSVWTSITMLLLVLFMAFFLNRFNVRYFFITYRTYLPAFFYLLLSGFFPELRGLNPVIPGSFFLVLAISRLIESYKVRGTAYQFYEAGILLGIASLFYLAFIWFLLFLWIGGGILRSVHIREMLLAFFGLITPHLLVAAYYFLLQDDVHPYLVTLQEQLMGMKARYSWSSDSIFVGSLGLLVILFASGHMIRYFNIKKIRSRKIFSLMFWLAVVSVLIFLLAPSVSVELVYVFSIPVSFLLAHYFAHKQKNIFSEVLFVLLFAGVLLLTYLPELKS